ncbi:MAG TPA: hypothetical protein VMT42_06025 [candidate division Zixibacteria bacterium]|nr:hypothetical protein [candidate division Zixibacteria bacterium]
MVMIMVTSWYPPTKAIEAAEKYIEVMQKIPEDASVLEPLVTVGVSSGKDGIEAIAIGNVKKGKFDEAMNLSLRRMVMFNSIEGYRWEIKTLSTLEEAMPLIGLAPP